MKVNRTVWAVGTVAALAGLNFARAEDLRPATGGMILTDTVDVRAVATDPSGVRTADRGGIAVVSVMSHPVGRTVTRSR